MNKQLSYKSIAGTEWTTAESPITTAVVELAVKWDAAHSLRSIADSLALLTAPLRAAGDAINLVKDGVSAEMAAQRDLIRSEMSAQSAALNVELATQRETLAAVVDELRERLRPESGAARLARERVERVECAFQHAHVEYLRLCLAYKKACSAYAIAARQRRQLSTLDAANLQHKLRRELTEATWAAFPVGLVVERTMYNKPVRYTVTGYSDVCVGALDLVILDTRAKGYIPAGLKGIRPVFADTPDCVIEESFK